MVGNTTMIFTKVWYYALAISSIAGAIIGLGIFGLPYVAQQSGFLIALGYLLFFGLIVGLTHLLYAEITLRTKEDHRFTGYVGRYFGPRWKTITLLQGSISLWGTLLIYAIVAAKFFFLLVPYSAFPELWIGVLFFALCSIVVWRGDNSVAHQELLFTLPIIVIIILIFSTSLSSPAFSPHFLSDIQWENWIAPYGVTLFALMGFSAIPMLEHILAPAKRKGIVFNYPFIVMAGTLLPAILYILFVFAVIGVNGVSAKAQAPLAGLIGPLGNTIVAAGALLGILAIYKAFIAVGNELQKTFYEDYQLPKFASFLLAFAAPFILYLSNVQDFIAIANFVGALMGGYMGVVTVLLFWKAQKEGDSTPPFTIHLSPILGITIICIFAFVSLYALATILSPFIFSPFSN